MKIAHLFYNLNIGGSETMVVDIMNNQVKYEDITLIVINKENDPRKNYRFKKSISVFSPQ